MIDVLRATFNEFLTLTPPDIHDYEGDVSDAVFDIMTIDSHVAGLATKLIGGGELTSFERDSLSKSILVNGSEFVSVTSPREPISLTHFQSVLEYARGLEELRRCLYEC